MFHNIWHLIANDNVGFCFYENSLLGIFNSKQRKSPPIGGLFCCLKMQNKENIDNYAIIICNISYLKDLQIIGGNLPWD